MFPLSLEAKAIAGLLAVAAVLGAGLALVKHIEGLGAAQCQAAVASAQAVEHAKTVAESARNNDLAAQLEAARAERKTRYATITRTVDRLVDRPVYRAECIDDDGLHSINAALAGAAIDTGLVDPAVPAASAAGR